MKLAPGLGPQELPVLLDLLKQEAEQHPDRVRAVSALHSLGIKKVTGASAKLLEVARTVPAGSLQASVPQKIAELAQHEPQLRAASLEVLTQVAAYEQTKAGKSASRALDTLRKKE